ncbi:unnamed protein product [Paramecium primaurelia]|uniref:Ribosomal protein/NADH dehydrogenase domain-containing protein n=2 Tax=Paramecium TaxID=5884 RepID=A0A8S1TWT0_9CILI|nr:unnamed protein product [Paramecium primaurelia]CAD8156012.1 unnamed protein product [Paramecium pentaurelia]
MSWYKQLGNSVKELRFVFCQTCGRSEGIRNLVSKNYWQWKDANPHFPFVVRECESIDPYVLIRYKYGVEKKALIGNLNEQELEQVLGKLVDQSNKVNSTI